MIINNLTHREIIFIRFQSNKTLFSGSLTLIPPLNPFGIYCKFAINSESKAVLSLSVKYQSNKTRLIIRYLTFRHPLSVKCQSNKK